MKKLLLLAIVLLTAFSAQAQLRFGVRGGMSTTEINPNAITIGGDGGETDLIISVKNANYGLHGGLFIRAEIGSFFIQPEALFNSAKVDYRIQDFRGQTAIDEIKSETYQTLDIPVMVGFKFGPVRLQGGPVGHLFLDSRSELEELSGYTQEFDELTYGWQAGVGFDIWKIVLDFRYEGNFTNFGDHITIFNEDFDFDKSPARIIASVGFMF